jgi:hypothetical protein
LVGGEKGVSSVGHRISMYVMGYCANRLDTYSTIPPDDIGTCDALEDSTLDHEEEVESTPCDEVQYDLGVDTPKWVGALIHDDSLVEHSLTLQDIPRSEDQSSTMDVDHSSTIVLGEHVDDDSTVDLSSRSYEVTLQHDRGVDSHES